MHQVTHCKNCGKPPLARAGSFTSYLFQHNYCQCNVTKKRSASQESTAGVICSNCGKSRPDNKRVGSFTSYLFKDLRCQCTGPAPRKLVQKKEHSRTAMRVAQKKQFTESIKQRHTNVDQASVILPKGAVIGGTFRIVDLIGLGGMGVVYLVEHKIMRNQFALKVLSPDLVTESSWRRFQSEAKTMASLNQKAFVKVYDLGIHDGTTPFYAMDYLQGQSLEEILASDGPFEMGEAIAIFIEVLNALAYAHRNGIIHRDIKPANIMISTSGSAPQVKILDFGISKITGSDKAQSMTIAGDIFGSPFYMSPEQCAGGEVDARSDIYAIGCTMFEVLTGYVPFEGKTSLETMLMHQEDELPALRELSEDQEIPVSLEHVINKCLEKLPAQRYQSAKELVLDLERVLDGRPVQAAVKERTSKEAGTHRNLANNQETSDSRAGQIVLMGSLLALILFAGAGYGLFQYLHNKPQPKVVTTIPIPNSAAFPDTVVDAIVDPDSRGKPAPFYSDVSQGSPNVIFNFPTEIDIGRIGPNNKSREKKIARGRIIMPANTRLTFEPNDYTCEHPEYFDRFRVEDLDAIRLPSNSSFTTNIERTPITATLNHISRLSKITSLILSNSQASDDNITALDGLTALEYLAVDNTKVTGKGLAQLKRIKLLNTINTAGLENVDDFLQALGPDSKLKSLRLDDMPSPLNERQAELLAQCPTLDFLYLRASITSEKVLAILAKSRSLKRVSLEDCMISPLAVANFKKTCLPRHVIVDYQEFVKQSLRPQAFKDIPDDWIK